MLNRLKQHSLKSFVLRLRLVFFVISLSMIFATTITHYQVSQLNQSIDRLTEESISVFVRQNIAERSFKALIIHLQQVERVNSVKDIEALAAQVDLHIEILEIQTLHNNTSLDTDPEGRAISDALSVVEHGAQSIFALRRAKIEHLDEAQKQIKEFQENTRNFLTRLNELIEDAAFALDEGAMRPDALDGSDYEELIKGYELRSLITQILLSIAHEVELALGTVQNLSNVTPDVNLDHIENDLRLRLRNMIQLLTQLPKSQSRKALTPGIRGMRLRILSAEGLINLVRQVQVLESANMLTRSEQLKPIERLSLAWGEKANMARLQIEIARNDLTNLTRRMFMLLSAATMFALLTILVALVFVVERQINRRIHRLTRSVLAISEGEIDYDVKVVGDDELGKMARALEVFKINAKELHRSNRELEKFAYVAAHDLRSPLRAIQDLSEWVLEDEDNVLSQESQESMGLLRGRIGRLNRLLSDLLEYARAGHSGNEMSSVSLAAEVATLRDLLDPEDRFNISLECDRNLIGTYEQPLRQILLNLIVNAIKHHDKPTGNISLKSTAHNGRLICSVQDDGEGIDPKFHERIFGLFQTLRPRDEVEGSGMGLALIHKLLENFEGTIEVISDPKASRGTTFVFELPEDSTIVKPRRAAA